MFELKIGSVQINNGFAGQYYLPYSIGTLQAYFLKFSKNLLTNLVIFKLIECLKFKKIIKRKYNDL